MNDFEHITNWIFDLDNTLYPRSCDLFAQVGKRMTQYVIDLTGYDFETAYKLQKQLYRDHGTTLNGLMATHNIDPEHFLAAVHDIDYSPVTPHPEFVTAIKNLPGRKFILTNADLKHADAVLNQLGGTALFDGVFDIKNADYEPKPHRSAYEKCIQKFNISPKNAAMFDDLEINLSVPHALGMRTVHILPDIELSEENLDFGSGSNTQKDHIHHATNDLPRFLHEIFG